MNRRRLIAVWKLGEPQWVWTGFPVWIGSIFAGLDRAPTLSEWGDIALFLATMVAIVTTFVQFANNYADRYEDRIYCTANPLVTGEVDAGTAKKAFIFQTFVLVSLLIALYIVTRNYQLMITLLFGCAVALVYNLPPFRFKEKFFNPLLFGLFMGLNPIFAWLAVSDLNRFIIAYAGFFFLHELAFGTTNQLRKTAEAVRVGEIKVDEDNIYNTKTVIKLKLKTLVALEAISGLGAFILIPIYWHLGIFDMPLSVALLTLPLIFMILAVAFRVKDPIGNYRKCEQFMGMSVLFTVFSFLGVALSGSLHWAYIILAFIFFTVMFAQLQRAVRPFGASARPLQIWATDHEGSEAQKGGNTDI